MRVHRNAKTNVYQRQLLIRRVRQHGLTQRRAAEAAGVSIRTVYATLCEPRAPTSRPTRSARCATSSQLVSS